jgi:hypothetical protein
MDMQHEHAKWTCSIDMQHGDMDMHHGHEARTARTGSRDMQHVHVAWTCSTDMKYRQAAWNFSIDTAWTCSIDMGMQHRHGNATGDMNMQHGQKYGAWI